MIKKLFIAVIMIAALLIGGASAETKRTLKDGTDVPSLCEVVCDNEGNCIRIVGEAIHPVTNSVIHFIDFGADSDSVPDCAVLLQEISPGVFELNGPFEVEPMIKLIQHTADEIGMPIGALLRSCMVM